MWSYGFVRWLVLCFFKKNINFWNSVSYMYLDLTLQESHRRLCLYFVCKRKSMHLNTYTEKERGRYRERKRERGRRKECYNNVYVPPCMCMQFVCTECINEWKVTSISFMLTVCLQTLTYIFLTVFSLEFKQVIFLK